MSLRNSRVLLPFALVAWVSAAHAAEPAKLDGKAIFQAQKCDMCHAVSSAGIQATGKIKAPDLTGTAAKRDAATLAKFLRKEDALEGKKHIKPFTGSDEELTALLAWLQKQNAADKK
jgi:mono/diheme cytochrome c family protein